MAFVLLRNSDQTKYQNLTNELISQYSMENHQYLKTITATTDILANHKHDNYMIEQDDKYKKQEKQDEDDNRRIATNEPEFCTICWNSMLLLWRERSQKSTMP